MSAPSVLLEETHLSFFSGSKEKSFRCKLRGEGGNEGEGLLGAELNRDRSYLYYFIVSMAKSSKILIAILLIALTSSQIVNLSQIFTPQTQATLGPEYQNADFLKKIDNYFGCKTWQQGLCIECSFGYIFNNNGVCCEIDRNCETFNRDVGVCEHCYTGFYINSNGTCTAYGSNDAALQGCGKWNNGQCVACSPKYYFGSNGACEAVSDQCRDWNRTTGVCTDCYFGYILNDGACVVDPSAPRSTDVNANPYCSKWGTNGCETCAERTFFNANGICQRVNDECWTWDPVDGLCLTCYKGYDLVNGSCLYSSANVAATTDPGCRTWESGVCLECSLRWVFNALGFCSPVQDVCRTFDNIGLCLTCYRGYSLINGTCVWSSENNAAPSDPGCKTWNNTICIQCSKNWVQDSNGFCLPVSEDCRTHDTTGLCTGCYKGYSVVNGTCVFDQAGNSQVPPQQGCHLWNWNSLTCEQCSSWWFLNKDGICQEVSPYCKEYSAAGLCASCFKGYSLTDSGACVVSAVVAPADKGCKTWKGVTCTECSFGWVFNLVGTCISVSDQCKTYDAANGECLTCYNGYSVVNGSCLYNNESPAQGGCKDWSWAAKTCNACADNWVLLNGLCVAVSDQCRTHDANGWCTACYRGYDLTEHKNDNGTVVSVTCDYSPSNTASLPDAGCHIWNWTTNSCQQCSSNWWSNNGQCVESNTYCQSFDATNGFCLGCYKGYDLTQHKNDNGTVVAVSCQYSPSNTAAPADKGCKRWNTTSCVECSQNWAFNADGVCQQLSDSCKTHDGFLCASCYNGFVLNQGACELNPLNSIAPSDAGCKEWDWFGQVCKACAPYWFMNNGICIPVSPYCKTYDGQGLCTSCFKGYGVLNGTCEKTADKVVTDAGCKTWIWDNGTCTECAPFWYSSQGVCTAVSPYCKTYDSSNGNCTSCYLGYGLANGVCQLSAASFCRTSDVSGCVTCYEGFVLYKNNCITLDSIANIALYYAECCPEKLAQLKAEGRIPQ